MTLSLKLEYHWNKQRYLKKVKSIFILMQATCYWVAVGEPSHKMRTGLSPTSKND